VQWVQCVVVELGFTPVCELEAVLDVCFAEAPELCCCDGDVDAVEAVLCFFA